VHEHMAHIDPVIRYAGLHPDFSEEIAYFYKNRVYSVQIESTLACGQGCRYCYAVPEGPPKQELASGLVRELLAAAAGMEVRAVDWLGGDPLLRKDWDPLMAYAQDLGLTNNIWSSGLPLANPLTAERAVAVTEGGFIAVHLDSLDPGIYAILHRGDPVSGIRTILAAVDTLQECGKPPDEMINCITLTAPVAGGDVRETIRYFREEKGMRTCLTLMVPAGSGAQYRHWIPSGREIRDAYEYRNRMNFPSAAEFLGPMDVSRYYCGGTVCVTADGDVTPCSVIRERVGNILREPFEAIVARSKDDLLFTPLRVAGACSGGCAECTRGMACWGCRASAFCASGDMLAADPFCWMHPAGEGDAPDRRG
jgi:radical SAM protein with 4Fe4S-binding SPASM domain